MWTFFLISFHRKRDLVQVPGHLTDDIEQLAEIVRGRGKEIVSVEVRDTGTHWNVREKESGTEKESERDIGWGREKEEECLHLQQGDLHLGEGKGVLQYLLKDIKSNAT